MISDRIANRAPAQAVTGGHASPDAPMSMPAAVVHVYPDLPGYLTVAYQAVTPVPAGDYGHVQPHVHKGRHARLRKAGRP